MEILSDPTNCIGVRALADTLSLQSLHTSADFYIVRNFRQVIKSDEFLRLTASEVERMLLDNRLNVSGEEIVLAERHFLGPRFSLVFADGLARNFLGSMIPRGVRKPAPRKDANSF